MSMFSSVSFKLGVAKDLRKIESKMQTRILEAIEKLKDNLSGDVKKLTNFSPEYRLRVGNYRVLFEIEDNKIIIHEIKHRGKVY